MENFLKRLWTKNARALIIKDIDPPLVYYEEEPSKGENVSLENR